MSEQEFLKEIEKLNITLTEEQKNKLNFYADYLLEYNKHTNLTAIKTKEEVYLKHFYDSLTLVKTNKIIEGNLLLDIGTGAGFPGMVLAIVFPNLEVHLLDSNHKKIDFLNELIQKLELQNVKTIYERSEEYVKNNREKYDLVTSRAVAELRILLEIAIPALKMNGSFLAMKSYIEEELTNAQDTISILNSEIIQKIEFELPEFAGKRTILEILKKKVTPNIYPRPYSLIVKKALKKKGN